ncbi:hypothetical protein GCM10008927_15950 [Amylibacter ulvae]|uniref:Uncharacterized protein n=1 Tax=Paramylibacter ulvae TaxID=1651968 RepID=A0ABQ3CZK3_9RHOB|nr:hypothetical protein [Amylibacter ulvae]GHA51415.1 hypothetical protein GCM10008927_15950 [Amylibacter ulvae]
MKRTLTLATTAAVLFGAVSASALTLSGNNVTKTEIQSLGFSAAEVQSLTDAQVSQISNVLHSGEDADIRGAVRGLMVKFAS